MENWWPLTSEDRLRTAGLRATIQRVAILDYLQTTTSHPTAEEIGSAVNRAHPAVSRASVYNVLHSLHENGLIREVVAGGTPVRYDARMDRHDHLLCRVCKRVDDIPASSGSVPAPPGGGHRVESCEILWRGVCADCATQPQPGRSPRAS